MNSHECSVNRRDGETPWGPPPLRAWRAPLALAATLALLVGGSHIPASASQEPSAAGHATHPVTDAGTADPEPGADVGSVPALAWAPCPADPGAPEAAPALECATYDVPLDYAHPGGGTATLALTRRPAADPAHRIGSLFLNPGGPGGSGTGLPASDTFDALGQRFDLIGFDPRGVGASTPTIECADAGDLAGLFDAATTAPDPVEGPLGALEEGRRFAASCEEASGELLNLVGTEYVARDLDLLRAAAGDEKLTYLGFSYGTYLGTVYADLFPDRVRAVTLDGAVDPNEYGRDLLSLLRKNYRESENALTSFLTWCAEDQKGCSGFGGDDPRAAFDALVSRLDEEPVEVVDADGQVQGLLNGYTVVYLAYLQLGGGVPAWPGIGQGLAALTELPAQVGEDAGIPTNAVLLDSLGLAAPNVVVECVDAGSTGSPITPQDFLDSSDIALDLAPTFGPALVSGPPSYDGANGAACAQWGTQDESSDWEGDFRAEGAAPVLVVGATQDPSTPYSGAVTLAATLDDAALLTRVGQGHTSYGDSPCIRESVDAYLIEGTVPRRGVDDRCTDPSPAEILSAP